MKYEECLQQLQEGSVVTFREYVFDRHQRRKLSMEIQDGIVKEVWKANQTLPRDVLTTYYGEELEDITYMQLATSSDLRIVISLGVDVNGVENVKIVTVNKDFYNTGLQELEVTNEANLSNLNEPNYILMNGGWN